MISKTDLRSATRHRLFPAFAGLWCAALFGLGSLALPVTTLEQLVALTGLPALVPATAPPLGTTARALVTLALAVAGFGAGLALALRLRPRGAAKPARSTPTTATATATAIATPAASGSEPDRAPPGRAASLLARVRNRDAHPDAPPRRPLILSEDLIPEEEAHLGRPAATMIVEAPAIASPVVVADAADPFDLAGTLVLAEDEPVDRDEALPVSDDPAAAAPTADPADRPLFAAAAQAALEARAAVGAAPLESLGLVQLIERLALAIAERRAHHTEAALPESGLSESALPESVQAEAALIPEGGDGPVPQAEPEQAPAAPGLADPAPVDAAPRLHWRPALVRVDGDRPAAEPGLTASPALLAPVAPRGTGLALAMTDGAPATSVAPVTRSAAPAMPVGMPAAGPLPATAADADEALRHALATLRRMAARG